MVYVCAVSVSLAQQVQFMDESLPSITASGAITVSETGDLSVTCANAASCQALVGGGSTPTAVLSIGATATVNTPVAATLSSSGAPAACVGTATPATGVSGWVGLEVPASGTRSVTFTAAGTYMFQHGGQQCGGAEDGHGERGRWHDRPVCLRDRWRDDQRNDAPGGL